jgi:hypothetical protein
MRRSVRSLRATPVEDEDPFRSMTAQGHGADPTVVAFG